MVEMLEHVRHLDNEEMPNTWDVEDWLNLENELSTSPQMFDEEILATVVGGSMESKSVWSDEEDEGEDEKLESTKEAAKCFKKYLSWMESQNDIDPLQLMQLRRMMDFAMRSSYKSFLLFIFFLLGCVDFTIKMTFSLPYTFCLHFYLIKFHIFDYPDSRLSGLFTEVPTSPDTAITTTTTTIYY